MKLKTGFHLQTTSTHLLPIPPAHNNNQPMNNVNLAVNEIAVSDREENLRAGNDRVTVYSLYDDESVAHGRDVDNPDNQLPRPSENLRMNEYGFLELLDTDSEASECTDDDDDEEESSEDESSALEIPAEEPDPPPTLSCVTCGCFGLALEFYDERHCTYDCSVITRFNTSQQKKHEEEEKKKLEETRVTLKREAEEKPVEVVDCKRIKVEVVEEVVEKADAESTVVDNPFKVNDLLEAIDPQHQSLFCPCIVSEVLGYRLLCKFVGYSDKYSFWVNADSGNIFPVNWTKRYTSKHGTHLHFHPPPNFTSWEAYIEGNESFRVAPECNFAHVDALLNGPVSPVTVGMKVEAVDRGNKHLICVATITCVMGDRFLVHFDSWDSLYDYWTWSGSGDIHPVGHCKAHGIDITPPHCYENASEFDWEEYLKKTNSSPIPPELIKPPAAIPYEDGQTVEVIDKRSPRLLRTAIIKSVDRTTQSLSITFPSLKSEAYDYELCAWSTDVHPSGWGASTGHPLADDDDENEPTPPDSAFPICPSHKVCKSVCNVRGPNFPFHSKLRDCPFAVPNVGEYSESARFTDRVVVFEDAHYDLGGGVKNPQPPEQTEQEPSPEIKKEPLKLDLKSIGLLQKPTILSRASNPINFNKFGRAKVKSEGSIPKRSEILGWSHDRISNLVQTLCSNLPTAQKVADQFRNNLIDGESFLMLTQSDMTDALGIKLGPAVKIYNLIRLIDLNK